MQVYQNIEFIPSPEVAQNFLWCKVYQQIHLALAEQQNAERISAIGLGFPGYNAKKRHLGSVLRLFAPDCSTLENFNARRWLTRLQDYIHITGVRDVPEHITAYKRYKRVQPKPGMERLARRKAKRSGLSYEEALQELTKKGYCNTHIQLPFINVRSLSSGHTFRLFILEEECSESLNAGFSCYGLSAKSSLPSF